MHGFVGFLHYRHKHTVYSYSDLGPTIEFASTTRILTTQWKGIVDHLRNHECVLSRVVYWHQFDLETRLSTFGRYDHRVFHVSHGLDTSFRQPGRAPIATLDHSICFPNHPIAHRQSPLPSPLPSPSPLPWGGGVWDYSPCRWAHEWRKAKPKQRRTRVDRGCFVAHNASNSHRVFGERLRRNTTSLCWSTMAFVAARHASDVSSNQKESESTGLL